jgi:hypothetical protein
MNDGKMRKMEVLEHLRMEASWNILQGYQEMDSVKIRNYKLVSKLN